MIELKFHIQYVHDCSFVYLQLKLAEHDKQLLQEQLSRLQQDVGSYSLEIVDLRDRLERSRRKLSEKKRRSLDKLHSSK